MMTALKNISVAETLIVGMGITGLSCARFLQRQGVAFRVVDSRVSPPFLKIFQEEFVGTDLVPGKMDKAMLEGIQVLILSPGVSSRHPFIRLAADSGIRVIGDIELFSEYVNAPVIAITGSNGKSTVTTLLGHIFQHAGYSVGVGGNLGVPALDLLCDTPPDFYILELSSFQLELTESLSLKAAVVLNISEDHMDRYTDLQEYALSKAKIYRHATCCVLNKDDPWVSKMHTRSDSQCLRFTSAEPEEGEYGLLSKNGLIYLSKGDQALLVVDELKSHGQHNQLNALAALALAENANVPLDTALAAIKQFKGLPHRCQLISEKLGVRWVNDSKATNIAAAQASINSASTPIILVAGGDGKGAEFKQLRETVFANVKVLVLLGKDAALMNAALGDIVECIIVPDMQAAVNTAADRANTGDTVLLAPACASIDMYDNYEARGEDFIRCVEQAGY